VTQKNTLFRILIAVVSLQMYALPVLASSDIEKIYRKQCGVCHGDEGDGRGRAGVNLQPPASSFISPDRRQALTPQYLAQIIRDGKPGTAMVAYGRRLSEVQIAQLASYIRDRFVFPKSSSADKNGGKVEGRAIYVEHCSACHGDNGNTAVWAKNGLNPAPRNFTSKAAREELSLERMITSVTHGRPGTAMMSFEKRLSGEQIKAVVGFIRNEFMLLDREEKSQIESVAPPQVDKTQKSQANVYPDGLVADEVWGKAFYLNNCFTCHGKNGNGKGPRAHFNQPRPRDFTSAETRATFDRQKLFQAIKSGKKATVMPAWGRVLSDQQVASVAEFVYQEFILASKAQKKKSLK